MKLSKTHIKAISAILVTLIFVGAYGFVFATIKNKSNQTSVIKNRVDFEIQKDQRLQSIKLLTADLYREFKQIDTYFVSEDGVVDFLEFLEGAGSIAKVPVHINSVSVNGETNDELPYELLTIRFVARGSWSSVAQLMSLIDAFALGITIERVQLKKIPDSDLWEMNTDFTVLKLK